MNQALDDSGRAQERNAYNTSASHVSRTLTNRGHPFEESCLEIETIYGGLDVIDSLLVGNLMVPFMDYDSKAPISITAPFGHFHYHPSCRFRYNALDPTLLIERPSIDTLLGRASLLGFKF